MDEIGEDDKNEETNSKRRKITENKGSTSLHQSVSDMRQAFVREEFEEVSVRKKMRLAGEQGVRHWYTWKQDGDASTSGFTMMQQRTSLLTERVRWARSHQSQDEYSLLELSGCERVPDSSTPEEVKGIFLLGFTLSN